MPRTTDRLAELPEGGPQPRRISEGNLHRLANSLWVFGDLSCLVYNEATGGLVCGRQRRSILAGLDVSAIAWWEEREVELGYGEARFTSAEWEGSFEAPGGAVYRVRKVRWPADFEAAARVAANNPFLQGEWTAEVTAMLDAIETTLPEGAEDLGFDTLLADVLRNQPRRGATNPDDVPGLPEDAETELGDVWRLGRHRLACGDTTDPELLARLAGDGDLAALLFTSPPYWVGKAYEGQSTEAEIDGFIHACADTWAPWVRRDEARIVINTGTAAIHRVESGRRVEVLPLIDKWQRAWREHGWLLRHVRIWAKSGGFEAPIAARNDVVNQHWEHLLTFERGDWSYVAAFWSPGGAQRGMEKLGVDAAAWAQQGVWTGLHGERSAGGRHVAAFPVELPLRHLRLYTRRGETVLEPFCGSGTTIVAAEQLDRRCLAVELDPRYCDAAVQRWEAFTGRRAERLR